MAENKIQMIFNKGGSKGALQHENEEIRALLDKYAKKLHTKSPIKNIEIDVAHQKNAAGRTASFSITLAVRLMSGKVFVAKTESRIAKSKGVGMGTAIKKAFSDIERQYKKTKKQ